jgi:YHS domain-containing protein
MPSFHPMAQSRGTPATDASTHVCPACGSRVDSLRAGHVAILDGQFQYFCDERCKRELYLQSSGAVPLPSEVETREPPPVASVPSSATRSVVAPVDRTPPLSDVPHEEPPTTLPSVAVSSAVGTNDDDASSDPAADPPREKVPTLPSLDQSREPVAATVSACRHGRLGRAS